MVIALLIVLGVVAATVIALAAASVRVLREYERGVVFRLGRVIDQKGPGLVLLIPAVDRMVRVSLRTVTMRIPHQEVITRDNVPVKVAAVVYFRVMDPRSSVVEVENHRTRRSRSPRRRCARCSARSSSTTCSPSARS